MEPLVLNETADPPFHSTHANLCSCDRSVCQQDLVHLRHCRYAHRPEFGASYLNFLSLNMGIMPATLRNHCDNHRSLCPLVPNQQSHRGLLVSGSPPQLCPARCSGPVARLQAGHRYHWCSSSSDACVVFQGVHGKGGGASACRRAAAGIVTWLLFP